MKNKKDYLIIATIVAGFIWAAMIFFKPAEVPPVVEADSAPQEDTLPAVTKSAESLIAPLLESSVNTASGEVNFGPHLQEIGKCLSITNTLNEAAKPSLADLQSSMQSTFGEMINMTSDWKNTHITLPSGEKRRVRIELEAKDDEPITRHLQYYSVDAEGLPVPIPLTPEQETNPSDTFLAGLESEGEVTLQEEAHRGFYPSGVEVYYVERNGSLAEIEMNYHGKSVRCQDLDKPQGLCNCF
jgi:hypothetical protein